MTTKHDSDPRFAGSGAAYLRVSEDRQESKSQHEMIHAFLERHGLTIAEPFWFKDEGWARDTADRRPAFQKLIALAESGKVQWIIVDMLDRFGTKGPKQLISYLFRLEQAGCKLYDTTAKEWTGSDFATEILALVGGKESLAEQQKISRRALRGHTSGASLGESQGATPGFGLDKACFNRAQPTVELWRVVYQPGVKIGTRKDRRGKQRPLYERRRVRIFADGREENCNGRNAMPAHNHETEFMRLVPSRDPAKRAAVRWVFTEFATTSIGFAALARTLNERRFSNGNGGPFTAQHVERMLHDPAYKGTPCYNRRSNSKFTRLSAGQLVAVQNFDEKESANQRADWIVSGQLYEPIVDAATWQAVQDKLDARPESPKASRTAAAFLNGLVVCSGCGAQMTPQLRPHPDGDVVVLRKGKRVRCRVQFYCAGYQRSCTTGRAAASPCRRNPLWQHEIEDHVQRWLEDAGRTWGQLLEGLKAHVPDGREAEVEKYWGDFQAGLQRVMHYLAEHHTAAYNAVLAEAEARARGEDADRREGNGTAARSPGLARRYSKKAEEAVRKHRQDPTVYHATTGRERDFIASLLSTYRTHHDGEGLAAEIARLDAKHTSLTAGWADLPTPRAKAKARVELEAIEARMAELEQQRTETAASVEAHYHDMLDLERRISQAAAELARPGGERDHRLLAQKLRGAIRSISCTFEAKDATRRGQPTAQLVEVEIDPFEGEPVSYSSRPTPCD
jgi:hypothetical protein